MSKKQKKKKLRIVILVLSCLVSVLAGLFAGFLISNLMQLNHSEQTSNTTDTLFDIRSDTTADSEKYSGNIIIPCWDNITMVANQEKQNVTLYNPTDNDGIVFQLVMTLDDGTVLYSSDLIPAGKALYEITLEKTLEPGIYNANLQYNCYSTNGNPLNGSNLQFTLTMEENKE